MPLHGLPFVLEATLDTLLAGNSLSSWLIRVAQNFTQVSIRFSNVVTDINNAEVQYRRAAPARLARNRQLSQDRPQHVTVMDTSTNVTNEQEQYDNATSDVATHDGPDTLSTHTESSCTVTLKLESNHILQAMHDDQPSRTDFKTLPDPVQNTACSNNVERDKVKDSCRSTSSKETMNDAQKTITLPVHIIG